MTASVCPCPNQAECFPGPSFFCARTPFSARPPSYDEFCRTIGGFPPLSEDSCETVDSSLYCPPSYDEFCKTIGAHPPSYDDFCEAVGITCQTAHTGCPAESTGAIQGMAIRQHLTECPSRVVPDNSISSEATNQQCVQVSLGSAHPSSQHGCERNENWCNEPPSQHGVFRGSGHGGVRAQDSQRTHRFQHCPYVWGTSSISEEENGRKRDRPGRLSAGTAEARSASTSNPGPADATAVSAEPSSHNNPPIGCTDCPFYRMEDVLEVGRGSAPKTVRFGYATASLPDYGQLRRRNEVVGDTSVRSTSCSDDRLERCRINKADERHPPTTDDVEERNPHSLHDKAPRSDLQETTVSTTSGLGCGATQIVEHQDASALHCPLSEARRAGSSMASGGRGETECQPRSTSWETSNPDANSAGEHSLRPELPDDHRRSIADASGLTRAVGENAPRSNSVAECYRQLRRLVDKKFSFAKRVTKLPTTLEEKALPLHVKGVPTISWDRLWAAAERLPLDARDELQSAFRWTWDATLYASLPQQDTANVLSDVSEDDIALLIKAGIISPQCEPKSLGRAFTVVEIKEKPDGEIHKRRRPILWPRAVNLGLKGSTTVVLPNVEQQLKQIAGASAGTHACSFDLKTSFFQIPLSAEVSRYFSFRLNDGRTFSYNVLPMGFVNSVKVMQTLLVTLGRLCCPPDASFSAYVDNIRFVGTYEECHLAADTMTRVCSECRITLNEEEGNAPHREGIFLGIRYQLTNDGADISLPPIQVGKLRRDSKRFCQRKTVDVFEQVVGRLFWASAVVLPNLACFYYAIKFIRKTACDTSHGRIGPCDVLLVPPSVSTIFAEWFARLLCNVPRHINKMGDPHLFLATDAADHGWGGVLILEETGEVLTAGGAMDKIGTSQGDQRKGDTCSDACR